MTRIPEDVIQRVQDSADIRQIVSEYVPIKKRGNNWVGLCPFHNDRDPSFTVNEDKQIFHCFGCGIGGGVFKFLMLIEGMSFVEAVKTLARRYGIPIVERSTRSKETKGHFKREELIQCIEFAQGVFVESLLKKRSGLRALAYLKDRGIDEQTIRHIGIGWAQAGWDTLTSALKEKGYSLEAAKEAGIVIEREGGGYYDRFRQRITFPIHDRRGNIVAFGGRLIEDGEPKYINSPESLIYKKKECLYGYYVNRSFIRSQGTGIIVEGYMDLVALFQFGIRNVCATLGTALTPEHAMLMKGITKDWVLVFDADEAGLKAASRALPILYSKGLRPRVLTLPEGHDPDSFIRKEGRDAWESILKEAMNGIDFVVQMSLKQYGDGAEGKIEAAEEVLKVLSEIDDPIRKSLLVSHVSQLLGIKENTLLNRLKQRPKRNRLVSRTREKGKGSSVVGDTSNLSSQAQLLSFILNNPHRIEAFVDAGLEYWLVDPGLKSLWEGMVHAYEIFGVLEKENFLDYIGDSPELLEVYERVSTHVPPLEDSQETVRMLLAYCENMRKRELKRQLIMQLFESNGDEETILRRIGELH